MTTSRPSLKLLLLVSFVAAGGALAFFRQNEDTIRRYSVERAPPRDRMLGAIILHKEQAWFFKLAGSVAAVEPQAASFRALVQSARFGAEPTAEPTWTLPADWTSRRGDSMRFATIDVGSGDSKLECSVTVLPISGPDKAEYLLANLNRWREQIGLSPIGISELPQTTERIALGEGLTATLADMSGQLTASGMRKPSMAGGRKAAPGGPLAAAGNASSAPIKYEVPNGWQPGELEISRGGITVRRAAAFEVREGDQRLEITVTSLPASAILANVNRWRGQIGLDAFTLEQFEDSKHLVEFAGSAADFVMFSGAKETIYGVIAQRGGTAWFVKLQGPTALAEREQDHFQEFVGSIRME